LELELIDAAPADMDYSIEYSLSGGPCYYLSEGATGEVNLFFNKGSRTAEKEIVIHSKEECWQRNDPQLEGKITLQVTGRLLQVGEQEVSSSTPFKNLVVVIQPIIAADEEIRKASDLRDLEGKLDLAHGVVILGKTPACIESGANANAGFVKGSAASSLSDEQAAEKKIVIDFSEIDKDNFPSYLESDVGKLKDFLRSNKKSSVDCEVYVDVEDRFMGYIKVGQRGTLCNTIIDNGQGPAEKLFCQMVSGGSTDMGLDGTYSLKTAKV
jgi:hypothetical protein